MDTNIGAEKLNTNRTKHVTMARNVNQGKTERLEQFR